MSNAQDQRERFPSLPPSMAPLWAGVLGVPAVWAIQLQAVYALSRYACAHEQLWLLHLLHIAGLILAAIGGMICLRYWHRQGEDKDDRTRFLASWGMMISSLFFLTILAQTIAGWMLDPCAT